MFAAAAMSLSSVCVVTNALRLNLFKSGRENKAAKAEINTKTEDGKMKKVMKIDGMMCSHCTGTVSKVLNAIDGVTADVSLEDKCAYITLDKDVADEVLSKAVTDAGYKVKGIKITQIFYLTHSNCVYVKTVESVCHSPPFYYLRYSVLSSVFLCRILLNYRHFDYRLEHISVYFDIEDTTAGFREAL